MVSPLNLLFISGGLIFDVVNVLLIEQIDDDSDGTFAAEVAAAALMSN